MHEFHLMRQVVKMVEAAMREAPHAKPSVVRLRVSAGSYLLEHDPATLQSGFAAAAHGTVAQGARVEIIAIPATARCSGCGRVITVAEMMPPCSSCGSTAVELNEGPEVVVQEVVVTER
jgi:hydrogenase nickel incorporation protein HypA/HybF